MTVEQTVEIPDDYRLFIDLPRSVPSGVKAIVKISIPAPDKIAEVRHLIQKEMAQNGTVEVQTVSGGGWEAHARERYAAGRDSAHSITPIGKRSEGTYAES